MKYITVRHDLTEFEPSKKARSPPGGTAAMRLYYNDADIVNYTTQTARWVCDLPGGFCRFLRPGKFSLIFSLRKAVLHAKPVLLNALLAERESTTTIPTGKG